MNNDNDVLERLKLLDLILNNSFGNTFVTDADGIVVYVNNNAANAMGMKCEKLTGQSIYKLHEQGNIASSFASMTVLKTGKESTEAVKMANGVTLAVSAKPIFDDNGRIKYVVVFSQNKEVVELFMKAVQENNEVISQTLEHFVKAQDKEIVVESIAFKNCLNTVARAASVDSTIILYGESGSGKEVLARYVHNNSGRKKNMFITVNCAAIPANLAESEFFGYAKGAFTGANREGKVGLFEMADGGTLFLDEIGEMDVYMQSKLLRVLETGEIRRVGGNDVKKVDVRIVASTNKNLTDLIKNNKFREDLYYRLNVIPVIVPPLRERKEDIEALSNFFLEKLNTKYNSFKHFDKSAVRVMQSYKWPGNVRELRNIIERLHAVVTEDIITAEHLKGYFGMLGSDESDVKNIADHFLKADTMTDNLKEATDAFQKEFIKVMIKKSGGNVVIAASEMGLSKSGLYKKLKSLGMKTKWAWEE